ncbi:MAG TPA: trimeric intracellular cation channel family protein [Burkholderiaceae bacterium]|nr:trimeric intracellular cation channel family protein [Burkholderiaceae bacterium]
MSGTPPAVLVPAIEWIAVLAGAYSGFAEARTRQMDPVGIFAIAFVTAFGGGTLRDLLLDRRPFFWVEHTEYVFLIFVLTLVAAPVARVAKRIVTPTAFVVADAIGLGFFSISGAAVALALGSPWIVAAMMGVITGVCGGLLRDVILNEVPMVLRDGQPYAIVALAGCLVYLGLIAAGSPEQAALWSSATLIVVLRLAAWRRGWIIK